MRPRRRLRLAVAALVGVAVWFAWPRPAREPAARPAARPTAGAPRADRLRALPPTGEARSPLADQLNSPATDASADLRVVAVLLDAFRSNFPRKGNPTGTNDEITAALAGANPLGLVLLPPDHPAINAAGELCDRWGTPYFFHAESGTRMALRSAGPDRRMRTADDIVHEP